MGEVVIPEVPHSRVGPSSFARAEACPASVVLASKGLPGLPTSEFAAEGTAAHHIMEQCLLNDREAFEFIGEVVKVADFEFEVDGEMADHIDSMLAVVREEVAGFSHPELEVRLDYPEGMPLEGGYGYADVVATDTDKVFGKVLDLKYGAGIPVGADSIQLAIYLVSLLERDYGSHVFYDGPPREVLGRTVVLQPRGRGEAAKPKDWNRQELQTVLARMRHTLGEIKAGVMRFKEGDHCRFCPAIGVCPHLHKLAENPPLLDTVGSVEVLDLLDYDAETLDRAMAVLPALDLWKSEVVKQAMRYLEAGGELQNAKLVQKRAMRKWKDEDEAQLWLDLHGVAPFQEPKLLTPPMAEKKLAKNLLGPMSELVVKESSGLTITTADDNRPAVSLTPPKLSAALRQQTARRLLDKARSQ